MWRKLGITIAMVALTACGYSALGPAELDESGNPLEVVDTGIESGVETDEAGN